MPAIHPAFSPNGRPSFGRQNICLPSIQTPTRVYRWSVYALVVLIGTTLSSLSLFIIPDRVTPVWAAEGDSIPASMPTTVTGALILIAVTLVGLLVWIVKRQFDTIDRQGTALAPLTVAVNALVIKIDVLEDTIKEIKKEIHS